jgi:hypothetical protein
MHTYLFSSLRETSIDLRGIQALLVVSHPSLKTISMAFADYSNILEMVSRKLLQYNVTALLSNAEDISKMLAEANASESSLFQNWALNALSRHLRLDVLTLIELLIPGMTIPY